MWQKIKKIAEASLDQVSVGIELAASSLAQDQYQIALTGLSQSGKSMLFTTLITLLNERAKPNAMHVMPLLRSLPVDEVEGFELCAIEGYDEFPIQQALAQLQQQNWPAATDQVYGFELVLQLKSHGVWDRALESCGGKRTVVFQFYDYPGEWLTDLPMLNLNYTQWCERIAAQMTTEPQRSLSREWLDFLEQFDFEKIPTPATIFELTEVYCDYLRKAKSQGLSLLQPSGFLLETTTFNWQQQGFVPLPSGIANDLKHPWTVAMNAHFVAYQTDWLTPLHQKYFMGFDRQIVLVDLFAAVAHGKAYLEQLKEALIHLSDIFVQEQQSWWQKWWHRTPDMSHVALVATKADLLPRKFQPALLSLLKEVSKGAQEKYAKNQVAFDYYAISSIQATKEMEAGEGLYYLSAPEEVRSRKVSCFPKSMSDVAQEVCAYQAIDCLPPKDAISYMVEAQNLDRLFDYMMSSMKECVDERIAESSKF